MGENSVPMENGNFICSVDYKVTSITIASNFAVTTCILGDQLSVWFVYFLSRDSHPTAHTKNGRTVLHCQRRLLVKCVSLMSKSMSREKSSVQRSL